MKIRDGMDVLDLITNARIEARDEERARWVTAVNEVMEAVNDGMMYTRISGPVALRLLLEKMEAPA